MNDILRVSIIRNHLMPHREISDEALVCVLRDKLAWREISRETYIALAQALPAGARVLIDFGRPVLMAPSIDEALSQYELSIRLVLCQRSPSR